jgi:hypothetical protein
MGEVEQVAGIENEKSTSNFIRVTLRRKIAVRTSLSQIFFYFIFLVSK